MDLVELTEFMIKSIVKDVDDIKIEKEENDKEIILNVTVNESDMGKLIGRNGKVINSIRTILQEACSLNHLKHVRLEVNR